MVKILGEEVVKSGKRVSVTLSKSSAAIIEEMSEDEGISESEVINKAVKAYAFITTALEDERALCTKTKEGVITEVVLL